MCPDSIQYTGKVWRYQRGKKKLLHINTCSFILIANKILNMSCKIGSWSNSRETNLINFIFIIVTNCQVQRTQIFAAVQTWLHKWITFFQFLQRTGTSVGTTDSIYHDEVCLLWKNFRSFVQICCAKTKKWM